MQLVIRIACEIPSHCSGLTLYANAIRREFVRMCDYRQLFAALPDRMHMLESQGICWSV